jgi:Sec-independent protein translocase protein TatA
MRTTVGKLFNAVNGPGGLNKLANMDLPVRAAYTFGRLIKSARTAVNQLQKERERLFEEYGEPVLEDGKDTGRQQIKKEHEEEFTKEVDAFTAQEREIWFEPIQLNDLEAMGVRLSPVDMNMMAPFIIGAEAEEEEKE